MIFLILLAIYYLCILFCQNAAIFAFDLYTKLYMHPLCMSNANAKNVLKTRAVTIKSYYKSHKL